MLFVLNNLYELYTLVFRLGQVYMAVGQYYFFFFCRNINVFKYNFNILLVISHCKITFLKINILVFYILVVTTFNLYTETKTFSKNI